MSTVQPVLDRGECSFFIEVEEASVCRLMGRELNPAELFQGMLSAIDETKKLANEIVIDKAIFLRIAFFFVELRPLVDFFAQQQDLPKAHPEILALHGLANGIDVVYGLARNWTKRSRIYLLYCCRDLAKEIYDIAKSLAESLKTLLEETITIVPSDIKCQMMNLQSKLLAAKFFPDLNNEELARTISAGLSEGLSDEANATSLLKQIATHLRMPLSSAAELKMELQRDKHSAELEGREDLQVIKEIYKLVENAAVLADVRKLASEDSTVGRKSSFTPPSSFFCPITGQLMQDPVVVESGFTYEKSAILEWFQRGHKTCPDTGVELLSLELIPNLNHKQAIDEFFDRMSKEQLTRAIEKIRGKGMPSEVEEALITIEELIEHNPNYKRYLVSLDGVQPLVGIIRASDAELKNKILRLLCSIAELGDEYKAGIIDAGVVPVLLRVLTKNQGDNGDAVRLLWEISKVQAGRETILSEQGSLVIVASAVSIGSVDQNLQAEKLLENLCNDNPQVVFQVAMVGYFKPLVTHLSTGNDELRLEMATSVGNLNLNEFSSANLIATGAVPPLLEMLKNGPLDGKIAAAKALRKLSCVDRNKASISKAGAIPVLVKYITCLISELKVEAMATLANLATDCQSADFVDQEGAVSRLLGMLSTVEVELKEYALRTLLCMAKDSRTVRLLLKDLQGMEELVYLLQSEQLSAKCRQSVLGLLSHLASDRESRLAIIPTKDFIRLLLDLLESQPGDEEIEHILQILYGMGKLGTETKQLIVSEKPFQKLGNFLESGTMKVKECALAVLSKISDPLLDRAVLQAQLALARLGVIPHVVELLHQGSDIAKMHAAVFLGDLSTSTPSLAEILPSSKKFLAKVGMKRYKQCKVHMGKCTIKTTLCLVESGAIPYLISLIKEGTPRIGECAVNALLTLLTTKETFERGVDLLVKHNVIAAVVTLVGKTPSSTEHAVKLLERVYKCKKYQDDKYAQVAKNSLVVTMTMGTVEARRTAATALMHLNVMPQGSTFTG